MSRLQRPYIPLSVRIKVAERQLMAVVNDPDAVRLVGEVLKPRSRYLTWLLVRLFRGNTINLDHDPPLAARPRHRHGLSKKTYFTPDANDPDYLIYRVVEEHRVKTNIRGEHGQYSDRALIKRARRRERPRKKKVIMWGNKPLKGIAKPRKFKWPKRPFQKRKSK